MNGAPSTLVSPGLWGFFAFFLLGLALYLLMRNMNARMRRMSYRSEELAGRADGEPGRANGPASGESPSTEPPQASDGQAEDPNR